MDDIPVFYTLEKATDLTNYLTDVYYLGTAMDGHDPDDHLWIPYMDGQQQIWVSHGWYPWVNG